MKTTGDALCDIYVRFYIDGPFGLPLKPCLLDSHTNELKPSLELGGLTPKPVVGAWLTAVLMIAAGGFKVSRRRSASPRPRCSFVI